MKTPLIDSPIYRSKMKNQSFGLIDQTDTNPMPDQRIDVQNFKKT